MTVIVVMVVASLIVALGFLAAFFWAVRSGQFDDTTTPSMRILFESRPGENKESDKKQSLE